MTRAKSNIIVKPFGVQRQAIVSFEDTHIVIGSETIRDTVSETSRPQDLLLGALATDCTFACQDAAKSLGISQQNVTTFAHWVESGVVEIRITISGLSDQQCEIALEMVKANCDLYQLLVASMTITLEITG